MVENIEIESTSNRLKRIKRDIAMKKRFVKLEEHDPDPTPQER